MMRVRLSWFPAFLVVSALLIGATVVASGGLVGRFFEAHVLARDEQATAEVVRAQARQQLDTKAFTGPTDAGRAADFQRFLEGLPGVFRVKAFDPTGRIVWSNEPRLIGRSFADNTNLARALTGAVVTVLERPHRSEHVYERSREYVAEVYVPIASAAGPGVAGVVEAYRDVSSVMAGIHRLQGRVWTVATTLGALLYVALGVVVWRASVNERRAIDRLESHNHELRLIQDYTRSILQPLDAGGLAARVVERAGAWLGLVRTALYRVTVDGELVPLAAWPAAAPPVRPHEEMVTVAFETRRRVDHDLVIALPLVTQRAHLFVAELARAPADQILRSLDIMVSEAAVALANAELYTELREAHERLAAILAGVADRMLIVDRDMRVTWMNGPAAAAGAARTDMRCYEAAGEGVVCDPCPTLRAFHSGRVERGVRAQRTAGDRLLYLDLVAAPLRDASGEVRQVLEVGRDITDLMEMEQRLEESTAQLEESHSQLMTKAAELELANRALCDAQAELVARERLAAVAEVVVGLHHAILNPLTGILGALQVLKQEGGIHARTREALAEAEGEIRKIAALVRRLPDLRRVTGTPYIGGTMMADLADTRAEDAERAGG